MKYKYTLMMLGDYTSEEGCRAAFEFGKNFPLFRDHALKLVSHTEYQAMIDAKEISPGQSYWEVKPDKFGFVILSDAPTYTRTYGQLKQGLCDFITGWNASRNRPVKWLAKLDKVKELRLDYKARMAALKTDFHTNNLVDRPFLTTQEFNQSPLVVEIKSWIARYNKCEKRLTQQLIKSLS